MTRERNGKYGFEKDWSRICKCGHVLGIHAGQNDTSRRPCFNEDTGIKGATGVSCDCEHFRPTGKRDPHYSANNTSNV